MFKSNNRMLLFGRVLTANADVFAGFLEWLNRTIGCKAG
jgi:hypothetical protein